LFLGKHTSGRRVIALTFRVAPLTLGATPLRVRVISKPADYSEIMERKVGYRASFIFPLSISWSSVCKCQSHVE
jgi:hypothetical protein